MMYTHVYTVYCTPGHTRAGTQTIHVAIMKTTAGGSDHQQRNINMHRIPTRSLNKQTLNFYKISLRSINYGLAFVHD